MSLSLIRQNYNEECEGGVNRAINLELYASYVFLSQAYNFDRGDIALPGHVKYFKKKSDEKREHAEKLMKYQNLRGGRIVLQDIKSPSEIGDTGLIAMEKALEMEKHINQSLLDLHAIAENRADTQLQHFLKGKFLNGQVEAIKEIGNYITQLKRVGSGLGEYSFDKETLQES